MFQQDELTSIRLQFKSVEHIGLDLVLYLLLRQQTCALDRFLAYSIKNVPYTTEKMEEAIE